MGNNNKAKVPHVLGHADISWLVYLDFILVIRRLQSRMFLISPCITRCQSQIHSSRGVTERWDELRSTASYSEFPVQNLCMQYGIS